MEHIEVMKGGGGNYRLPTQVSCLGSTSVSYLGNTVFLIGRGEESQLPYSSVLCFENLCEVSILLETCEQLESLDYSALKKVVKS